MLGIIILDNVTLALSLIASKALPTMEFKALAPFLCNKNVPPPTHTHTHTYTLTVIHIHAHMQSPPAHTHCQAHLCSHKTLDQTPYPKGEGALGRGSLVQLIQKAIMG